MRLFGPIEDPVGQADIKVHLFEGKGRLKPVIGFAQDLKRDRKTVDGLKILTKQGRGGIKLFVAIDDLNVQISAHIDVIIDGKIVLQTNADAMANGIHFTGRAEVFDGFTTSVRI